jgi:hypothetical protein
MSECSLSIKNTTLYMLYVLEACYMPHQLHTPLWLLIVWRILCLCIPVASRSKAWVCGRFLAGIAGSNLARSMDVMSLVSVYQVVQVFASGWSLFQRRPTECGLSECDREAWIVRRTWSTRGLLRHSGGGNCLSAKVVPVLAWTGPEGCRRLRLPNFKTIGTWGW